LAVTVLVFGELTRGLGRLNLTPHATMLAKFKLLAVDALGDRAVGENSASSIGTPVDGAPRLRLLRVT
jgi:hypothetical protein